MGDLLIGSPSVMLGKPSAYNHVPNQRGLYQYVDVPSLIRQKGKCERYCRCVTEKGQFTKTPEQGKYLRGLYSGGAAQAGRTLPASHRFNPPPSSKARCKEVRLTACPLYLEGVTAACAATRFIHMYTTSFQ